MPGNDWFAKGFLVARAKNSAILILLIPMLQGYAVAQQQKSVTLYIDSLRAPGYGSLDSSQCNPNNLACLAAAAQNAGPVPALLIDAFKGSFPSWVKFVGVTEGAKKVVGGVVEIRSNPPDVGAQCEASGFVAPGAETGDMIVAIDAHWAPPYGTGANEQMRRDNATGQCLAGLGKRMSEQL